MQEELVAARQAAATGDRASAVMLAHQELERDVARFQAARALVSQGQRNLSDFDMWQELRVAVERVAADASVCLRLFNPRRKLESTRGMATAHALYGAAGKAPSERVVAFADAIAQGLDHELPLSVTLDVGRALEKMDARIANSFLSTHLWERLPLLKEVAAAEDSGGLDASARVRRTALGSRDAVLQTLPMLASLAASCNAHVSGNGRETVSAGVLAIRRNELAALLPSRVVQELLVYEEVCLRELPQKRARLQAKERRQEQATAARSQQQMAAKTRSSAVVGEEVPAEAKAASDPLQSTTPTANPTTARTALQALTNPLRLDGWKLRASQAALVCVALFLLRLLARKGIELLQGLGNVMRASSSHPRRRRLTL